MKVQADRPPAGGVVDRRGGERQAPAVVAGPPAGGTNADPVGAPGRVQAADRVEAAGCVLRPDPLEAAVAVPDRPATAPGRPARHDLLRVLAATVLAFALSAAFELHEFFAGWAAPFERWQLDELPIAAAVLGLGLAAAAVRARRAAVAELRARIGAEQTSLRLLAHNRELSRRLIGLQETERRALARELHDELGAHCSAIRVEAACLLHAADRAEMAAAAARTATAADALYASVRSLLRRLRPAELDELGLLAALQALCEAWETRSGVACVLHHRDDAPADGSATAFAALGDALDTALYRVTQEALTNVLRHAGASQVRIVLSRDAAGGVRLRIADDGHGFDATQNTCGLGLLGVAERAAALGGRLEVHSAPGSGTRLELSVPAGVSGTAASASADTSAATPATITASPAAAPQVRAAR